MSSGDSGDSGDSADSLPAHFVLPVLDRRRSLGINEGDAAVVSHP